MTGSKFSTLFPYASHYISVFGSRMHYLDEGEGEPILFIHDMPTSSYLWRNIIPQLSPYARCIAPDLIGMGKSSKPDIAYRVFEHIEYISEFIRLLNLQRITLVMHGWGSVIGFAIAHQRPELISGLAFTEAYIQNTNSWDDVTLPTKEILAFMQAKDKGYQAVMRDNILVDKALPCAMMRRLSKQEYANYKQPFVEVESRKPLWQFLQDAPLGHAPQDVMQTINNYSAWLQQTNIPKLLIYAMPGMITSIAQVQWYRDHLPNLQLAEIEDALHYPEEDEPEQFGQSLLEWYRVKVHKLNSRQTHKQHKQIKKSIADKTVGIV